ncbi:hypothetical protein OROMI_010450 [Orobanche minor]
MAGNRGKSKGKRDAQGLMNDGLHSARPMTTCPISGPSQGILAVPFTNILVEDAENLEVGRGGPSICRDGDPLPLLNSVLDGTPLQVASSHKQTVAAQKVHDESPSRDFSTVKTVSSSLVADLPCSEPPKHVQIEALLIN